MSELVAKHLVWLQTGFLGDIVITTAAFRLAKQALPQVKQYLITTPLGAKVLEGHPDLDGLFIFDKKKVSLLESAKLLRQALAKEGIAKGNAYLLKAHNSYRSFFLAKLLRLPTVGYYESALSFFLTHEVDRIALFHEAWRVAHLLERFGVERSAICRSMPYLPRGRGEFCARHEPFFSQSSPKEKVIAIAPGSVWGTKKWPTEFYQEFTEKLLTAHQDWKVVLLGSPLERDECQRIFKNLPSFQARILDLAGQTDFADLRDIYSLLSALIANDSAPIHFASAFSVPTLAIFGATVPAMGFGPLAPYSLVVEHEGLACRPCSAHGPMSCPLGHFKCMREITPTQVFEVFQQKLLGAVNAVPRIP